MKNKKKMFSVFLLISVLVFYVTGCSKVFGPSDDDVIKAINDSGPYSSGVEKIIFKSPIVVLEKGSRNNDGSWPVKIKVTITYLMADGHETNPMERTLALRNLKSQDSTGKTVWKAVLGS